MDNEDENNRNMVAATLAVELARGAVSNPNFDITKSNPDVFAASCLAHACAVIDQSNQLANYDSTSAH